jgi:hypothetical protein
LPTRPGRNGTLQSRGCSTLAGDALHLGLRLFARHTRGAVTLLATDHRTSDFAPRLPSLVRFLKTFGLCPNVNRVALWQTRGTAQEISQPLRPRCRREPDHAAQRLPRVGPSLTRQTGGPCLSCQSRDPGPLACWGELRLGHLRELALDNFSGRSQRHRSKQQNLRRPLVWGQVLCRVLCQFGFRSCRGR